MIDDEDDMDFYCFLKSFGHKSLRTNAARERNAGFQVLAPESASDKSSANLPEVPTSIGLSPRPPR